MSVRPELVMPEVDVMAVQVIPLSVERHTQLVPLEPEANMMFGLPGMNSMSSLWAVSTRVHEVPPLVERHKPFVAAAKTMEELPGCTFTCLELEGPVPVAAHEVPPLVLFNTPPELRLA